MSAYGVFGEAEIRSLSLWHGEEEGLREGRHEKVGF